jgi:DNA (cytosine-5)-methyltransferase 1
MKSIELFSGMGGLAKGLELAGFKHVKLVEYNKHACATLRLNFNPKHIYEGDIAEFDMDSLDNIDFVAGGPPCQPFSLGGKHKADTDIRDMFPYAIHAIEKLKPKAFMFENVNGLLRESFSEYFMYIILKLAYPDYKPTKSNISWRKCLKELKAINPKTYKGIKYDVQYNLLNAADYGVPQTRERVIIVRTRSDLGIKLKFPEPTHSKDRLLWEQYVTEDYWKSHKIPAPFHNDRIKASALAKKLQSKYGLFAPKGLPWNTVRNALKGVPTPESSHNISDHVACKSDAKIYSGHTGSKLDWPSKTIKAGAHGVPGGENMIQFEDGRVRNLTVYEAKLIQVFPKDFIISGAWGEAMRQIGNAVPVLLANILGKAIYKNIFNLAT